MNYYILCPENIVTGGTELAHQLCYEINKNGKNATMYYTDKTGDIETPMDVPTPEKYRKYCNTHVRSISEVDVTGNVVIVPESIADWAFIINNATICVWWMSVDNFNHLDDDDYIRALDYKSSLHLVQSYYAAEFLRSKKIDDNKLYWLSDYIGDIYNKFILPVNYRKNIILFNPKKGFDNIVPLIKMCDFAEWKPLINMTEEEMVLNMQLAKIYIDFGNHPGKDRIPREAAACGCCILTNKKGSAAFEEDVPIDDDYKFSEPYDYNSIIEKIQNIINNYENHFMNFDKYRTMILSEKGYFEEDTKGLISLFE